MSFLFGKKTQQQQQTTSLNEKQRHIENLNRAGAYAVNPEQTIFDVPMNLPSNQTTIFLRITLPIRFPYEAPTIKVTTPLQHPWVDVNYHICSSAHLIRWTSNSDLTKILNEIQLEFRRNPPTILNMNNSSMKAPINTEIKIQQPINEDKQIDFKKNNVPTKTQIPAIPIVFPDLEALSISQLNDLINDKDKLKNYVRKMNCVRDFINVHDELIKMNEEMALKNTLCEKEYYASLANLESTQINYHETQRHLDELIQKQKLKAETYHPDIQKKQLVKSVEEADKESEILASKFIHGETDISEFLATFMLKRKMYHLRWAKMSKYLVT